MGSAITYCPSIVLPVNNTLREHTNYTVHPSVLVKSGGERRRIESIRRASDIIMFGDGNQAFTDGGSWLWYDDWELETGGPSSFAYQPTTPAATDPDLAIPIDHNVDSDGATQYPGTGVRYRHGAGDPGPDTSWVAVMSFTDGHSEAMRAGSIRQKNVALTY